MKGKLIHIIEALHENPEIKMSEVILHLADDLLKNAKTKQECLQFIGMVCFAWNLSVLFNAKQQKLELEHILQDFDDPDEKKEVKDIIHGIVRKKQLHYSHLNRVILQYDLKGNRKNLRLNVISTLNKEKKLKM